MLPVLADVRILKDAPEGTQNRGIARGGLVRLGNRGEVGFHHARYGDAAAFGVLLGARNHAIVHTQSELRHVRIISETLYV